MNVKELIENIGNDAALVSYLNLIPKKNKKTQTDFMHMLNRLSYVLYLSGNTVLAEHVINKMIKVDFTGDYRYWEPVQNAALLAVYINKKKYLENVKKMIVNARNYGDEISVAGKQKVHKRFLTGARLISLKEELEQAENEAMQMNKRIILLFHLFYLDVFSDESELDGKMLTREIENDILILREYIGANGTKNLYPFK